MTARDLKRLSGVHQDLVSVVRRAHQIWDTKKTGFILQVSEGIRTIDRQRELYAIGRTKPGKPVTSTMNSRHLTGHAVDLVMSKDGVIPWKDEAMWDLLGECMLEAASILRVPIRWGQDWDGDGITRERGEHDSPHFELPKAAYP